MSPDFDDALRAAVDIARLAPSSHNSQPWGLAVVRSPAARRRICDVFERPDSGRLESTPDDHLLVLALDQQRELTALHDHRVEMYLSCGAYLHLLLEALRIAGWSAPRVAWNEAGRSDWLLPAALPEGWLPLAAVRLSPAPPEERERLVELAHVAEHRVTNRAPYREEAPADALLEPPAPPRAADDWRRSGVEVRRITERAEIEAIGAFVAANAGIDFAHRAAWRETHSFIRWSPGDHVEDGFPIEQLFGPMSWARKLMYRAALAPSTLALLARVGYPGYIAKQLGALVGDAPALVAFSLPSEQPAISALVGGGAAVMEFWLRATAAGAALHPISVILQHPDLRARFQRDHGLSGRVFFFARLGYPASEFPPAPRRRDPWSSVAAL